MKYRIYKQKTSVKPPCIDGSLNNKLKLKLSNLSTISVLMPLYLVKISQMANVCVSVWRQT